jgi:hypothetical protein
MGSPLRRKLPVRLPTSLATCSGIYMTFIVLAHGSERTKGLSDYLNSSQHNIQFTTETETDRNIIHLPEVTLVSHLSLVGALKTAILELNSV